MAEAAIHSGDCLEVLRSMPDGSVDAVVTDPPYLLGFMGRQWDTLAAHDHLSWHGAWAAECLRVLKPGGHLLAFGGTRTYHRLACAIEDAGFEIRDSITWLYGSGFPKSLDVSKAIDRAAGAEPIPTGATKRASIQRNGEGENWSAGAFGSHPEDTKQVHITAPATPDAERWQGWGTALKPASEPIVVARKPLAGTVAANVLAHGTGALNIDGCRVGSVGGGNACPGGDACKCVTAGVTYSPTKHPVRREGDFGRWPANVVLTHTPDCVQTGERRVKSQSPAVPQLDFTQVNGVTTRLDAHARNAGYADSDGMESVPAFDCAEGCPVAELDQQSGNRPAGSSLTGSEASVPSTEAYALGIKRKEWSGYADTGGASRFFPTFRYQAKAPIKERPKVEGSPAHPTVKPLALMRWLVRLVTPPGGTVLDPFAGSGTTVEACLLEGFGCIAIEREADYLPLIQARIDRVAA